MSEYLSTKIRINGKEVTKLQHRLIWERVNGTIKEGFIIHHKNGEKKDNRIENLECISKSTHTFIHNKQKKNKE